MTGKSYSLRALAEIADAELHGDEDRQINGVAKLELAGPNQLAFCTGKGYVNQLRHTRAGAVLVKAEHLADCPVPALVVADPYYAYAALADALHPRPRMASGVHPSAVVADDVFIGKGASVGANAVVEAGARLGANVQVGAGAFVGPGAAIGEDSRLAPGVHLGDHCTVGARVILHAGVVIGADGFGIAPGKDGWRKVPQLGAVQVGDDVEIGANSTVDRGALEDTIIEQGVKLDNLVHIAHNARIGAHTAIAGCTVVAGSTSIGKNCVIGGQSAITGHIEICDGVTIMGMTSVTGSIREPGVYSSPIPARPIKQWRRNAVRFTQLDDIFRRVSTLERHLDSHQEHGQEH